MTDFFDEAYVSSRGRKQVYRALVVLAIPFELTTELPTESQGVGQ